MAAPISSFAVQAVSTGAASDATLVAAVTGTTLYVQKLRVNFITVANGKKSTIQDTNSSPKVLAVVNSLTVAAAINIGEQMIFDFGKRGFKCTADKGLRVTDEGSGCVVNVIAEGYKVIA
jgi:hypothetical protein